MVNSEKERTTDNQDGLGQSVDQMAQMGKKLGKTAKQAAASGASEGIRSLSQLIKAGIASVNPWGAIMSTAASAGQTIAKATVSTSVSMLVLIVVVVS